MIRALIILLIIVSSLTPLLVGALPVSIRSETDVAGVWKLSSKVSFLTRPPPSASASYANPNQAKGEETASFGGGDNGAEALLVLSADGSFSPCKDDSHGRDQDIDTVPSFVLGGAPHGVWHFDLGRGEITLVPDRPDDADGRNVHDLILRGSVETTASSTVVEDGNAEEQDKDTFLTIADGTISIGRCMYPRKHANFFDAPGPIHRPTAVGTFQMKQVLGSLNTDLQSDQDDEEYDGGGDDGVKSAETDSIIYTDEDFFGRKFLLTVEPLPSRPIKRVTNRAAQERKEVEDKQPLDVRVLPVEFHGNRTFTARGVNKILRGRFRVTSESGKDMLKMDVSLFGAGRSAPGSVYSEGRGLSHEDERSYSGQIIAMEEEMERDTCLNSQTIFVQGSVVFGTDLGSDARPEPVGTFSMMEMKGD